MRTARFFQTQQAAWIEDPDGLKDWVFFRGDLLFTSDQGNDPDDQENEEKDFGDVGGGSSDDPKAENCGDDGDDEEDKGPVEHGFGWLMVLVPAMFSLMDEASGITGVGNAIAIRMPADPRLVKVLEMWGYGMFPEEGIVVNEGKMHRSSENCILRSSDRTRSPARGGQMKQNC